MTRTEQIAALERIANAMMTGQKLTLEAPDTLLKIAYALRTPDEQDADYKATNASAAAAALGAIKSEAKAKSSAENGKRGGRPRKQPPSA